MRRRTLLTLVHAVVIVGLAIGTAIPLQAGPISSSFKAYWDFEVLDQSGGSNPAGFPQASSNAYEGKYADVSGNGNDAYAASVGPAILPQSANGRFGKSFYSNCTGSSGNNFGTMAVVAHDPDVNVEEGESFTISVWEKVGIRTTAGGWVPGCGRSMVWIKANDHTVEGNNGLGLEYAQSQLRYESNSDGYGQTVLKGMTHLNWDNNQWAHIVTVGTYNAGSDNVTLKTFINGQRITGLDVTVEDELIDNQGYLTLGCFWRGGGYSWQRFLSWNTTEGYIDDVGRLDNLALTDGEAMAIYNLAQRAELDYDLGTVIPLLDVHRAGAGSVKVDELTWSYATGLTGNLGEVTGSGTSFQVMLTGNGTGLIGAVEMTDIPEPATLALAAFWLAGLGRYARRRRKA